MPSAEQLPEALAALSRLQAWELRDSRFEDDLNGLLAQLPASSAGDDNRQNLGACLNGEWVAEVEYAWGPRVTERLKFEVEGGELFGSATFLGSEHPLEDSELLSDGARFIVHSETVQGDETRRITHRYRVRLEKDTLHVRVQSTGGFTSSPPLTFSARRPE